jgi:hypothetical protein
MKVFQENEKSLGRKVGLVDENWTQFRNQYEMSSGRRSRLLILSIFREKFETDACRIFCARGLLHVLKAKIVLKLLENVFVFMNTINLAGKCNILTFDY